MITVNQRLKKDDMRIINALVTADSRDFCGLALATLLKRPRLQKALHRLTREHEPPLVNCLPGGEHNLYSLSVDGRKLIGIKDQNEAAFTATIHKPRVQRQYGTDTEALLRLLEDGSKLTLSDIEKVLGIKRVVAQVAMKRFIKRGLIEQETAGSHWNQKPIYSFSLKKGVNVDEILKTTRFGRRGNKAGILSKSRQKQVVNEVVLSPELERLIERKFRQLLEETFGPAKPAEPVKLNEPPAPMVHVEQAPVPCAPRQRLKKILVAGPKFDQIGFLEREFDGLLDLRFCNTELEAKRGVSNCDAIVALTDFINHSQSDIFRASRKPLIFAKGGITSVKRELSKLALDAYVNTPN